ncbi:hypothetical protein [Runella sp. SP2]|uniref:hypothetical protein n=1 Tax=Runella sp. SP2 TaxID=2268026 RepID=UPI000F08A281|nr:hypothetical protein [Runella sp. SP2]AYQ31394.1 hypothetical protein DTQ70_04015 [Runella sp. SP2]
MANEKQNPGPATSDDLTPREKDLLAIIEDMGKQLEAKKMDGLTSAQTPTVTHKGATYEVTAQKFNFEGTDYTIEDLKDAKLVAKLIDKKVGFLVKREA